MPTCGAHAYFMFRSTAPHADESAAHAAIVLAEQHRMCFDEDPGGTLALCKKKKTKKKASRAVEFSMGS